MRRRGRDIFAHAATAADLRGLCATALHIVISISRIVSYGLVNSFIKTPSNYIVVDYMIVNTIVEALIN